MSSLIINRRNFLRGAGGLAVTTAAPYLLTRTAAAEEWQPRVVEHARWQWPGRDPFGTGHKDAPRAVRALEGLTHDERVYFERAAKLLADVGWESEEIDIFVQKVKHGDEWEQMVNGHTRFRWVRDEPEVWQDHVPREQYVVTLTNPYTNNRVQVSIPKVCINARLRRLEPGQVRCIPLPEEEFMRRAVIS